MVPGPITSRNRVRSSLLLLPLISAVLCLFGPVSAFPQHKIPFQKSQSGNSSVPLTDVLTHATPNTRTSSGTNLPLIYPSDQNVLTSQMRDWWVQDGASFLNEYVTEFGHTKVYAEEGLVKSLMRCFLTNGQSQNDECPEIRQHFASQSGDQKAKLVVDGVAKFLALFGTSSEASLHFSD
ncbi:hypothetical protein EX30DRAFT_347272 [Ascodesmis nigricans]|uniref:Uncharacterized protein n=1 Tax=Ascodesmis nigricans TaxID=341454 RepID=A0A4S2N1V4_9PEZI|nr:hypothetical protein EX30DRAFT_347272 [Ascodesmis nigricans]